MGIECWKKIALPEIERKRQERWAAIEKQQWERGFALVEAIKQKDFSKITSTFKINFLNSLVTQFEDKGFISKKQHSMAFDMFNDKDHANDMIATYNIGDEKTKAWAIYVMTDCYPNKLNYFNQSVGIK